MPVLVGGAAVPQAGELPADLAAVLDWQVIRLDDDAFDQGRLTMANVHGLLMVWKKQ